MGVYSATERRSFEREVREAARSLTGDSRAALIDMLSALSESAERRASRSRDAKKWMMFGYWKVVGVYARHFRRLIVQVSREAR